MEQKQREQEIHTQQEQQQQQQQHSATQTNNNNNNSNNANAEQSSINSDINSLKLDKENAQIFSALTWGHNDQRLFVACTNTLHVLRIYKEIPSLSLMSQIAIKTYLKDRTYVDQFCLPDRLKNQLDYCFSSTIKSIYPKLSQLRRFVCTCLPNSERLHCTLKRMNIKSNHDYYTLYLEYLG